MKEELYCNDFVTELLLKTGFPGTWTDKGRTAKNGTIKIRAELAIHFLLHASLLVSVEAGKKVTKKHYTPLCWYIPNGDRPTKIPTKQRSSKTFDSAVMVGIEGGATFLLSLKYKIEVNEDEYPGVVSFHLAKTLSDANLPIITKNRYSQRGAYLGEISLKPGMGKTYQAPTHFQVVRHFVGTYGICVLITPYFFIDKKDVAHTQFCWDLRNAPHHKAHKQSDSKDYSHNLIEDALEEALAKACNCVTNQTNQKP